jgi:hypothetical protein
MSTNPNNPLLRRPGIRTLTPSELRVAHGGDSGDGGAPGGDGGTGAERTIVTPDRGGVPTGDRKPNEA